MSVQILPDFRELAGMFAEVLLKNLKPPVVLLPLLRFGLGSSEALCTVPSSSSSSMLSPPPPLPLLSVDLTKQANSTLYSVEYVCGKTARPRKRISVPLAATPGVIGRTFSLRLISGKFAAALLRCGG